MYYVIHFLYYNICYVIYYITLYYIILYYIILYYIITVRWAEVPLSALAATNKQKMDRVALILGRMCGVFMGRVVTNTIWIGAAVHQLILQRPNLPTTPIERSLEMSYCIEQSSVYVWLGGHCSDPLCIYGFTNPSVKACEIDGV